MPASKKASSGTKPDCTAQPICRASTVRLPWKQWQHNKSMYWLGLDVGTGGTRALLVDASGVVRYAYTAAHQEMAMARPLWAEQHPDDWWRASREAIQGVMKAAN